MAYSVIARRWQILRDGFNPQLEPIALDMKYLPSGCWLEQLKLTPQSSEITVEFTVQYHLKIISAINFIIIIEKVIKGFFLILDQVFSTESNGFFRGH